MIIDEDVKEHLRWAKPIMWALVDLHLGITLSTDSKIINFLLLFWLA